MKSLRPFVAATLALAAFTHAEILAPPAAAPQAVPAKVEVKRGERAEIVLRAYGKANQQLRFKLRGVPAHGRLTELKVTGLETASLVYEHDGAAEPAEDHFSYVVQSSAGVSAPAEVTIKINDDPPILVVPEEIDFGKIVPGGFAVREVAIENRGGGIATGTITVPEMWLLDSPPGYRLDRGERMVIKLRFAPSDERIYRGEMRYSGHPDRTTLLKGAGVFPIACRPEKLELRNEKGSAVRSVVAELENRTAVAQTVRLSAAEGLRTPARIEVPAEGKASLRIEAAVEKLGAFESTIEMATDEFSAKIPIRVNAVGPILRTKTAALSLGKASPNGEARGEIAVENIGGTRASVRTAIAAPFLIAEDDQELEIEPGKSRVVHLRAQAEAGQNLRAMLSFQSPEASLEVPVQAEGIPKPPSPPKQKSSTLLNNESEPAAVPVYSDLPPIRGLKVSAITRTAADLHWEAMAKTPLRYVIEQRLLSLDGKGELKVDWRPLENVRIQETGSATTAALRKLTPGQLYVLRIISLDPQGQRSNPSLPFDFFTLPKKPWTLASLLWPVAIVLLGAVIWKRVAAARANPGRSRL